jgi:hypothetical protein
MGRFLIALPVCPEPTSISLFLILGGSDLRFARKETSDDNWSEETMGVQNSSGESGLGWRGG